MLKRSAPKTCARTAQVEGIAGVGWNVGMLQHEQGVRRVCNRVNYVGWVQGEGQVGLAGTSQVI